MASIRQQLRVGTSAQANLFANVEPSMPQTTMVGRPELAGLADGLSPEQRFAAGVDLEHRRTHAQFFTPRAIADLMVELADIGPTDAVLDPACGPGIFVEAVRAACSGLPVTAVDIDGLALECLLTCATRAAHAEAVQADFLAWDDERSFDVVMGNPPYLKYQHFDCPESVYQRLEAALGLRISRLSNLYLLFLLEGYRRLRPGGRLVFIVPSEWTNANFGVPFKQFLRRHACLQHLIYFSHLSEQFDDALTTAAVIVLRKPRDAGSRHERFVALYVADGASLGAVRAALDQSLDAPGVRTQVLEIEGLADEKKWDHLLRHGPRPLDEQRGAGPALGTWCSSKRGVATGANGFFHISRRRAHELQIEARHLVACVGGSRHVQGIVFDADDYQQLVAMDQPSALIDFGSSPGEAELRYIAQGEQDRLPSRYLLSKRRPWYTMERINPAPVWIGVFGRRGLRAVRNRAGVANLTTFHGLYPSGAGLAQIALLSDALVVMLNSERAQVEAARRRRVYGAGLEKVEPGDLLDLMLPDLSQASEAQLAELAAFLEPMDREVREHGAIRAELAAAIERVVDRAADSVREQHALDSRPVELDEATGRHDVCIDPT